MYNYEKIIAENNGILYANKLNDYNINRHILNSLVEKGLLKKIEHGIKRDIKTGTLENLYIHITQLYISMK